MQSINSFFKYLGSKIGAGYYWFKSKVVPYALKHKVISAIVLIALGYGGYKLGQIYFSTAGETHYNISRVRKGDIITTVTGTGQVSASNQINLSAKASGAITYVGASTGDELKAGTMIAKIDTRDINLSLRSAQISLEKLTQPVDSTTLIQAQNSLDDAKEAQIKAATDLDKTYDDALTSVSSTFVDLPEIINGLNDMLYGNSGFLSDKNRAILSDSAATYRNTAGVQFDIAKNNYLDTSSLYKTTARSHSTSSIDTLLDNTYSTVSKTGEALKNAKLATDYIKSQVSGTYATDAAAAQTSVNNWTTKNNTHLSDLVSAKNQITAAKNTLDSSIRNVREKIQNLAKVQSGTDDLDIQSQQINLAQKQLEYENYIIRAPFDGVLAKLSIKKNDIASNGTTVAVFISKQKVADITLNEVDASKVKVGQPVELSFDAVDGITATGTVASIDLVGTVTSGVVTYNAQIAFDTQDDRIKSGMSVSAIITTENKIGILTVPSSAIKVKNGKSYVQIVQLTDIVADTNTASNTPSFTNNRGSSTRARSLDNASTTGTSTGGFEAGFGSRAGTSTGFGGRGFGRGAGMAGLTNVTLLNTPEEREIAVGISNDTMSEIISGLSENELVISKTIASTTKSTTTTAPSLLNVGGSTRGVTGGARTTGR